ncbi:MAG: GNAT family N-acetyltransferase [Chitinophagaceae bacterium]
MGYLLPQLTSDRLIIRYFTDEDLDDFFDYRRDPVVARYQGFDPFDRDEAFQFIQSQKKQLFAEPGQWVQQALELKEDNKVIGDCAVRLDSNNTSIAEVGCTISPGYQSKGFAKEALFTLMQFLFEEANVHRVVGITDAENLPSIRMLKSVGMREEGHFIENIWFKGKWGSEFQFAILEREWLVLRGKKNNN